MRHVPAGGCGGASPTGDELVTAPFFRELNQRGVSGLASSAP
ncbi:hypothetical protein BH20ACT6_BH20ACT6_06460 [soil metagenome]